MHPIRISDGSVAQLTGDKFDMKGLSPLGCPVVMEPKPGSSRCSRRVPHGFRFQTRKCYNRQNALDIQCHCPLRQDSPRQFIRSYFFFGPSKKSRVLDLPPSFSTFSEGSKIGNFCPRNPKSRGSAHIFFSFFRFSRFLKTGSAHGNPQACYPATFFLGRQKSRGLLIFLRHF